MSDGDRSQPEMSYENGYGIIKDGRVFRVFDDEGVIREFPTQLQAVEFANSLAPANSND